jgi:hypothetical protein
LTKPPKPHAVILHLQPSYWPDDPDGDRRLRAILKRLLRAYEFRLTKLECPGYGPQPTQARPGDEPHQRG